MIDEEEIDHRYPPNTPEWRKFPVERYSCTKHQRPTKWLRDADIKYHIDDESECK